MNMSKEVYEENCKYCLGLEYCKDWGVGCQKVAKAVTLHAGDTYSAGESGATDGNEIT